MACQDDEMKAKLRLWALRPAFGRVQESSEKDVEGVCRCKRQTICRFTGHVALHVTRGGEVCNTNVAAAVCRGLYVRATSGHKAADAVRSCS